MRSARESIANEVRRSDDGRLKADDNQMSAIQTVSRLTYVPLFVLFAPQQLFRSNAERIHATKNASIRYDQIVNAFNHIFKTDLNLIRF